MLYIPVWVLKNIFLNYSQDNVSEEEKCGVGCTISWAEPYEGKDKPVRDIGNCNNRLLPGVFVTSREQKKIDLTSTVLTHS
jgi:hypothetical protein